MGIFENIITGMLYLVVVLLDIMILFSSIRLLVRRWPNQWLLAFNQIGEPLADRGLNFFDQAAHRLRIGHFSERSRTVLTLCALIIIRFILIGLYQLLVRL